MDVPHHVILFQGEQITLTQMENIRLVTPAKHESSATVAARLARSSRLALDTGSSRRFLVVRGDEGKLDEIRSYRDVQSTRSAFGDARGHVMVLTDDILVSFLDQASDADREELLERLPLRIVERRPEFWKARVEDTAEDAPLLLSAALADNPIVRWAEPDFILPLTPAQQPSTEPRFNNQWTLSNTGQNGGTVGADIRAMAAWAITIGSPLIRVVVFDRGVDLGHTDLRNNLDPGYDFVDDDANPSPHPSDPAGYHGTAVAGIIAAAINGQGVTGVAPRCRIAPLRGGQMTASEYVSAFSWATTRGHVINLSWEQVPVNSIADSIRRSVQAGCTVVASAGNDGADPVAFPASLPEVIAVGASTNQDVRAGYSNFGDALDVLAPSSGGTLRVETTDISGAAGKSPDDYCHANDPTGLGGTSAATPLVSGIAALMLSLNPYLTPEQIRRILLETADKIDPANASYDANGWSRRYGFGRVNAAAALRQVPRPYYYTEGGSNTALTIGENLT